MHRFVDDLAVDPILQSHKKFTDMMLIGAQIHCMGWVPLIDTIFVSLRRERRRVKASICRMLTRITVFGFTEHFLLHIDSEMI